jgi:hypothetical protein
MKKFNVVPSTTLELESVTCDRCKRVDTDIYDIQEYFNLNQDVGYAGILGDGNKIRLDLCQYCFKEIFEGVYRIEGNYIWRSSNE